MKEYWQVVVEGVREQNRQEEAKRQHNSYFGHRLGEVVGLIREFSRMCDVNAANYEYVTSEDWDAVLKRARETVQWADSEGIR